MSVLRLLESVHGHLGALTVAALLHPTLLLRRGKPMSRGVRWSIALTTLAAFLAFASGMAIYPSYRRDVRAALFAKSTVAGVLFETKEHLAFFVLSLALGAGVCALAAPRGADDLRRAAAMTYGAATLLCLVVVALGTFIASVHGFE